MIFLSLSSSKLSIVLGQEINGNNQPESPQAVNNENFMPSHQVLFRRTDGELLLPALAPFTGALQQSASNSINNYYNRPSYGAQVPVAEPTCLLRSCDQYITGRDLTYQRALEIVENEEYLVAVDTDLIRRRNDDGR